ncbi:ADP-ribosylation factor-like protein 5B [Camelus ferus]|uniref:ADP-ribosylation factor-like protein 5B n=1 Tax=Camelus ferus TaxID=419612 RepID=A0A8B8TNW0_CAMFR|nr:ADP-ribosylation factor-like protein 5B [Camelus ferus]
MNEVVHTSPTIGSNVEETVMKNTHFLTWDIGGQESLRSSWNTYYTNTEFIIPVVDSIDGERLAIIKEVLYRMLAHEEEPSDLGFLPVPIINICVNPQYCT